MSNTYTWKIESLEVFPFAENQTNVVHKAHWRVNGSNDAHKATVYGVMPLAYVAGDAFTAYENLTEEKVIKWVKEVMGSEQVASILDSLDKQLELLANPISVSPQLPWSN